MHAESTSLGELRAWLTDWFVLQGVAMVAEKLPSCLLEKAFSKSLDVLSPLAAVERSPSQLLENALSLPRAGTLELVLERFHSSGL